MLLMEVLNLNMFIKARPMLLRKIVNRCTQLPFSYLNIALSLFIAFLCVSAACAVELTEEQQQMLNQLSPDQQSMAKEYLKSHPNIVNGNNATGTNQNTQVETRVVQPRQVETGALEKNKFGELKDQEKDQEKDLTSDEKDKKNINDDQEKKLKETSKDEKIHQFGYELFAGTPTTFAPATDIPIPVNYVIGPGDTIMVQLFGKENAQYDLTVSRDGSISFPGLGPVPAAGQLFDDFKTNLNQSISEQMIGVKANITMGPLRTIRVFVLGDVEQPGSYAVSSLSSMTNALFVSGGIKKIGSLRNVQLKRQGQLVGQLDLYDLLLKGDTSKDERLQPGDVIFVPPIGKTINISGEVKRPAIYEITSEHTINDVLTVAGGLAPTAFAPATQIERVNSTGQLSLIDLNLSQEKDRKTEVRDGDKLRVYSVLEKMDDVVTLNGHVERPRKVQFREGLRLADVIPSVDILLPRPDLNYVLIRRELPPDGRIEVASVKLAEALSNRTSNQNIFMRSKDQVWVFGVGESRDKAVLPILQKLERQASVAEPLKLVSVTGQIRVPGDYPLENGMKVSDLIRAGGNLSEEAYTLGAEITRFAIIQGQQREAEHFKVDIAKILAGDKSSDISLKSHDVLNIKEISQWHDQEQVEIKGEVKFPGVYAIKRGETLKDVIKRAGGFTDKAFLRGAVFMRESLKKGEQEQLDKLTHQLQSDITANQISDKKDTNKDAVDAAKNLLSDLKDTQPVGRLVVNLPKIMDDPNDDIELVKGDQLFVPLQNNVVAVIGEVNFPTSHRFQEGLKRDEYVNLSGGTTYKADAKRIYVVKADGMGVASQSGWFKKGNNEIEPGDTIVVPLDVDRVKPITLWSNVSQIVYQIALSAAAFKTVGGF